MKRVLVLLSLLVITLTCFSQAKFENDTLYTESGFKVFKGQKLNIGVGSTDDGDFKFIRANSTGLGNVLSTTSDNAYNKQQQSLKRRYAGHIGEVVKIVKRGTKRMGFTYEPIITFGDATGRYEIDIDNAIKKGELKVPEEYQTK